MESFTEKELLATINDMGYDLSPEELVLFKKGEFILHSLIAGFVKKKVVFTVFLKWLCGCSHSRIRNYRNG